MLQNLEETASDIIHYRARTVHFEHSKVKAHTAFNPRLGKEAKLTVFPGYTAQELTINPVTGGYVLTHAMATIDKENKTSIDLTNDEHKQGNTVGNQANTGFKLGIPQTEFKEKEKSKTSGTVSQLTLKPKQTKPKKKKDKTKNTGKKRRQSTQEKVEEPPKKRTKLTGTEETPALFTPLTDAEKAQNLTNTSPFHKDSRSNSESRQTHQNRKRKGSKSRRREIEQAGDDYFEDEEYHGNLNLTNDPRFKTQEQILAEMQPPQHQPGLRATRDPRLRKNSDQIEGTGRYENDNFDADDEYEQDFDVDMYGDLMTKSGPDYRSRQVTRLTGNHKLGGDNDPNTNINMDDQDNQQDDQQDDRDQDNDNNNNNSGNSRSGRQGASAPGGGGGGDDDDGDKSDDSKGDDGDGSSVSETDPEDQAEDEEEEDDDILGEMPKVKLTPDKQQIQLQNENAKLRKQINDQRKQLDDFIKKSKPGVGAASGPGSAGVAAGPDISMYHNMLEFQQEQLQNMMRCANSI